MPEEAKVRCLLFRHDAPPEVVIGDPWELVGGYIEVIMVGGSLAIVADEEALLKVETPKPSLIIVKHGGTIVGPCVLVNLENATFADLTDEQIEAARPLLVPIFWMVGSCGNRGEKRDR